MASGYDFLQQKDSYVRLFSNIASSGIHDINESVKELYSTYGGSDLERKLSLDQAFREAAKLLIVENDVHPQYSILLDLCIEASKQDLCSVTTVFVLLSDIFDEITIDRCEDVFEFVESHVSEWKSEDFYNSGKNYLLRMCNDILKRLSKSHKTVFCGRIQLFLARLFPLTEKSGLNLQSQFNLDNVSVFSTASADDGVGASPLDRHSASLRRDPNDSMDVADDSLADLVSGAPPVDYALYRKFWALQDFFRKPNQCYERPPWKQFTSYSKDVMEAFASSKLDDTKSIRRKLLDLPRSESSQEFFAKYLTSEKLFNLQLSDSNFRRYVLVQFLILFQYLGAKVKFKSSNQVLGEEQVSWLQQSTERVYQLIRETPPEGEKFASLVERVLSREERWNGWKNEGCPSFVRTAGPKDRTSVLRLRKRSMADRDPDVEGGSVKYHLGSAELTRLWNLKPDNVEACRSPGRAFLPTLEAYFEEAIEQNDPVNQIEEQYKLINNDGFGWRALRLLSRRSPHFFVQTNQPAQKLPVYLESMVQKLAKEMPAANEDIKTDVGGEEMVEEDLKEEASTPEEDMDEERNACVPEVPSMDAPSSPALRVGAGGSSAQAGSIYDSELAMPSSADDDHRSMVTPPKEQPLSKDFLGTVAAALDSRWELLARRLKALTDDDIAYFKEKPLAVEQATNMLQVWLEIEGTKATQAALDKALREASLVDIADRLWSAAS